MSTITAIVPTYNRARFVVPCVKAILSQSRPVTQILVIDDGSEDDTANAVRQFGSSVTLISTENRGKSAALNLALSHASGDYIWIIDDDDLVRPDAGAALAGMLDQHADIDIAYGRHDRFRVDATSGAHVSLGTGYWKTCDPADFLIATMEDFFAHQPGMLVRKSLYDRVGGFDETLTRSIDYEMLLRLARNGRAREVLQIIFDQRVHDGQRGAGAARFSASERNIKWVDSDRRFFEAVYSDWSLSDYLPAGSPDLPGTGQRRALLQRATIMARKKLWTRAVEDWALAAEIPGALTPEEIATIRRSTGSKYDCKELTDQHWMIASLRDLCALSDTGVEISQTFAHALLWPIRDAFRHGDFRLALARAVLWFRVPKHRRRGRSSLQADPAKR